MLRTLITSLRDSASNDPLENRRLVSRRKVDQCVALVGEKIVPIENWSEGGVLLNADERLFGIGQMVNFTLKFKLRNTILDVKHKGHVVRKASGKVAVAFDPISAPIKQTFQLIIDDHVAREFASSQA